MENYNDTHDDLLVQRAVLAERMGEISIRLCKASEDYNQVILDMIEVNRRIKYGE